MTKSLREDKNGLVGKCVSEHTYADLTYRNDYAYCHLCHYVDLSKHDQQLKREIIKELEQAMLDKILFIGERVPPSLTADERPKFILLGTPQELIDTLAKIKEM